MIRDHSLIEELLAVRVLDGLDGDDVERLERELLGHGDCEECRRLESELNDAAGWLASVLDPAPMDAAAADAILDRARTEATGDRATRPAAATDEPSITGDDLAERRARSRRTWVTITAAAAAFLIVLASVAVLGRRPATKVVSASPTQTVVTFTGSAGAPRLSLLYTPGTAGFVLWGTGIPDLGPGKVYEVWAFHGKTPASAGCLTPSAGAIATTLPVDPTGVHVMAVTVESASCPPAPTTTPILTASLA
jgi:hypothetical protein